MAKQLTVLTPAAAMTAKKMYQEVDGRGRRIHSYRTIARYLMVSESTILRVITESGAYMGLPEAKTDATLDLEAQESQIRFFRNNPDIAAKAGATTDVVDKMAEAVAKAREKNVRGDTLLRELEEQPQVSPPIKPRNAYGKDSE